MAQPVKKTRWDSNTWQINMLMDNSLHLIMYYCNCVFSKIDVLSLKSTAPKTICSIARNPGYKTNWWMKEWKNHLWHIYNTWYVRIMRQQHIPNSVGFFHPCTYKYPLVYDQWSAPEEWLQMSRHQTCHSHSQKQDTQDLNTCEHTKQEHEFSHLPNFLHFLKTDGWYNL